MGTRSLTKVFDGEMSKEVTSQTFMCVNMYRHYDGYPSGHGSELADFLVSGKIVNGLSMTQNTRVFNGIGCLSAQLVDHFKDGAGGIYLYPTRLSDNNWQEYEYHVYSDGVRVYDGVYDGRKYSKAIFAGSYEEFKEWCEAN